jgi:hypothetical protein
VRVAHAELSSGTNAARGGADPRRRAAARLVMTATPDPVELGEIITYSSRSPTRGHRRGWRNGRSAGSAIMYSTSGCRQSRTARSGVVRCGARHRVESPTLAAGANRTVQFVGLAPSPAYRTGTDPRRRACARSRRPARAEVTTTVEITAARADLDDIPDRSRSAARRLRARFGNRAPGRCHPPHWRSLPPGVSVVDDGGATIVSDVAIWNLGTSPQAPSAAIIRRDRSRCHRSARARGARGIKRQSWRSPIRSRTWGGVAARPHAHGNARSDPLGGLITSPYGQQRRTQSSSFTCRCRRALQHLGPPR